MQDYGGKEYLGYEYVVTYPTGICQHPPTSTTAATPSRSRAANPLHIRFSRALDRSTPCKEGVSVRASFGQCQASIRVM